MMATGIAWRQKLELKALHKSIHRPMRKWYNGGKDSEMLNKEYGEFPLFYQELAEWPHFTKVMQLFEEFTEASSSKQEEEKQTQSTPGATDEPTGKEKKSPEGNATGRRSGKDEADGAIARWEREKKAKVKMERFCEPGTRQAHQVGSAPCEA